MSYSRNTIVYKAVEQLKKGCGRYAVIGRFFNIQWFLEVRARDTREPELYLIFRNKNLTRKDMLNLLPVLGKGSFVC